MESSRWDLLNDMAEHVAILKNNQNMHHPRFCFTPETGIAFPKTGFCFYLGDRTHTWGKSVLLAASNVPLLLFVFSQGKKVGRSSPRRWCYERSGSRIRLHILHEKWYGSIGFQPKLGGREIGPASGGRGGGGRCSQLPVFSQKDVLCPCFGLAW